MSTHPMTDVRMNFQLTCMPGVTMARLVPHFCSNPIPMTHWRLTCSLHDDDHTVNRTIAEAGTAWDGNKHWYCTVTIRATFFTSAKCCSPADRVYNGQALIIICCSVFYRWPVNTRSVEFGHLLFCIVINHSLSLSLSLSTCERRAWNFKHAYWFCCHIL